MNGGRTNTMMLTRSNSEGEIRKNESVSTPDVRRSSSAVRQRPDSSARSSPSSLSSSTTAPTWSSASTPSKSPVSPPRLHRFTSSPVEALRLFRGLDGVLPNVMPFGRVSSSSPHLPMIGWASDEQSDDQRERSKQLMRQWYECQQKIWVQEKEECQPVRARRGTKHPTELKSRPKSFTDDMNQCEMKIQSSSLEGTTEAAAWHLHGQNGGRVAPLPSDRNKFGKNISVMNSNAMLRMKKNDNYVKSRDDEDRDIESGPRNDKTNVVVDCREHGDTKIFSNWATDLHGVDGTKSGDMWSTGVASAIVMGTAARYNKTLFMFPHGRRVLLPLVMAIMALALSIFVSRSCRFMSVIPGSSLNEVFQIGPWFYLSSTTQSGQVCLPYPSDIELDFWFTLARAVSLLAVCLGVGLLLWTCTLSCIPYSRSSLNGLGLCFFVASMLQLATSFFYLSSNCKGKTDAESGGVVGDGYFGGIECTANQDLVFCIAASALYFATGWLLYIAQGVIANDPGASSSEVYTWSALAKSDDVEDGIKTIEKSWIRIPDGSTLMATVVVERKRKKRGGIKTTHKVKTEILPAS